MYKVPAASGRPSTKYEVRNTGCLPMSNIQRRVKNVEVVFIQKSKFCLRYFQFRTSSACRMEVFRTSHLTTYLVPCTTRIPTWYFVLSTWYLVLCTNLIRLKWLRREAKHKNEECEPTQNLSFGIHSNAARNFRVAYAHHPSK